jgi:hypothetical protein
MDPYERVGWPNNGFAEGSIAYWDSFKREMWRFQLVAKVIGENVPSSVECPPIQGRCRFQHRRSEGED